MKTKTELLADIDRVTAERDAALAELAQANEKIDKAWNRKPATDHKGFIPGAMDAWKRPVPQHLPYDFSGNPGSSATQYCNGWNDCGGYWSAHAKELQQRLTAADERAHVLEGVLRELLAGTGNSPGANRKYGRARAVLAGSQKQSAPEPYQGIPGTSFQRLNALANQGE